MISSGVSTGGLRPACHRRVQASRRAAFRPVQAASREVQTSGLSGEALSMFHDAQRNILELNKSRLMALDELKQAKERINELEGKCAQYEQALGAEPPRPSPKQSQASSALTTTIAYSSGWSAAYIHYQKSDGSWTNVPGQQMEKDPATDGLFVATLRESVTEFVLNNGANDWDSPCSGGNYTITGPGEFLVQSGSVSQLS